MGTRYALSSKIKDLCSSRYLKQLIDDPTRITPLSSTLLDLILTNRVNISVLERSILESVVVIRKFKRPKGDSKILKVRSLKNFVGI